MLRTSRQHHQAVEAERYSAGGRHARQGFEEILVDRVTLAMDPLFFVHGSFEARALFGNVGQLAEGIGEFYPAGVELETLGNGVASRLGPRQRGQRQRILI